MTRTVKWLVTGLCVSVGLNLLVAGFTVARMAYPGVAMHWTMERMIGRLSDDSQLILRDAMAAQRKPIGDKMRSMHHGHAAIVDLLGAEELDAAALDQAFADQRQRSIELQAALQIAIIQVAHDLPPEERIKLAQGGQRMMRKMMERDQRHRQSPPD